MKSLTQQTPTTKGKDIKRTWYLVDVQDKILGRATVDISKKLIGKHKTYYVPNLDCGDNVVVINARAVKVTGRKKEQKIYTRYSGYPGGLKEVTLAELMKKRPSSVIKNAVSGMLPKNKLRKRRLSRLHVYDDNEHPFHDKFSKK
ncbi:50S ribosomal protein L13 [Candidatus Roizmanbacteria bacterium RIFCSPHIGHO2_02_FULL_40_9]|uniref:Large ribosomal subunit protein uL13 n=2 Tax=Candidatus Roizmaniibacteriota TaxID=1752723 RepID=A0A1F7IL14_9BACT|nr:MAG: 50S ribosomal protein L13 [Candidatus Roizmanbacteria bacterium RIFCSPHIGHO2_02_FULL_40_9]OGK44033.1 MAG: 50S ribosomal protein L13 [Candidatus Roizmanbacteria bacterium RIFCSPLOWO2_01_FULL_38_11]